METCQDVQALRAMKELLSGERKMEDGQEEMIRKF